jgi:HD superfamily phosphohydrolase
LPQTFSGLAQQKSKIINDPIYGFITISGKLIYDLLEHTYFQRLRRITQLGLTYLVYPGAYHTRFHHALGALYLMQRAVSILRKKGHVITDEEEESVCIAILLHDIGHGPFSHALESTLIPKVSHEALSLKFMERLNLEFEGKLDMAIAIFSDNYPKRFLYQLIASQLDMDRLDYLRRDSFYTGVTEGSVNSERLLTMLNVHNDQLVIDAKGIYSVEKFIVARRLMYWQVYLHKTVLSAENMLVNILRRAKELSQRGEMLFATNALQTFLQHDYDWNDFESNPDLLDIFARLDDNDVMAGIKEWSQHGDRVLADLSSRLINRNLLKIKIKDEAFKAAEIEAAVLATGKQFNYTHAEAEHLIISRSIANHAYNPQSDRINLLYKNNTVQDISEAADQLNIHALSHTVIKHFLCYPAEIGL